MDLIEKNKNVLVFIDYENIHNILRKYYTNVQEKKFFEVLRDLLKKMNFNVLDITAYCNFDLEDMLNSRHQTWLLQHNINVKHTSNRGKNFADLQIAVDVLEQVYENTIVDGYVIISSDKDMIPLIKAIRRRNKYAYLIATVKDCDFGVTVFPNDHYFLEKLLDIVDDSGNEITPELKVPEDEVYKNLLDYANKQLAQYKHIESEYFVSECSSRLNIFEYEVVKILRSLNLQGKVFSYTYTFNTKTYLGLTAGIHKISYQTRYSSAIIEKEIEEAMIKECYNKFIKK